MFAAVAVVGITEPEDERLRVDLVIYERFEAGVENNSKDWKHTCFASTMLPTESVSSGRV